jgi:hypothetical protein
VCHQAAKELLERHVDLDGNGTHGSMTPVIVATALQIDDIRRSDETRYTMVARLIPERSGASVRGRVATAAGGLGAVWVAGYLLILLRQGTELDTPMTVFIATFVGVMAALAVGAAATHRRDEQRAQAMLYAAGAGFLPAGVVGLLSIGLPLILAGLLAFAAAGPRIIPRRIAVAAGALSAGVFVVGVALNIRVS